MYGAIAAFADEDHLSGAGIALLGVAGFWLMVGRYLVAVPFVGLGVGVLIFARLSDSTNDNQ